MGSARERAGQSARQQSTDRARRDRRGRGKLRLAYYRTCFTVGLAIDATRRTLSTAKPPRHGAARLARRAHVALPGTALAGDVHVVRTHRRGSLARPFRDRGVRASAQRNALTPYSRGAISSSQALTRAIEPLRSFMLRQTRSADVVLFERVARRGPEPEERAPITVLIPAFVVGELRSGFAIGFALYLPFVAIDLAVAAMLMGLGMMMLSPPVVSLPVKLLLFVMVDGWALLCGGVTASFR